MRSEQHLGITDYAVIFISLLIPTIIGIVFRCTGGRQKTMKEYFLAERTASKLPVLMSLTATCMSSVLMVGAPAEVYRFGPYFCLYSISCALGILAVSQVLVPVYFQCNVSSIYEFLELRFGKYTRIAVSTMFSLQMVLFSPCALLGSSLVLNATTSISVELVILLCGGVCTFYCFLGGMKAVLWADVFQILLMSTCLLTLHITGIKEIGIGELLKRANAGGRLNVSEFSLDFTRRYTVWNAFMRGFSIGFAFYGTTQVQVQRYLSMSESRRAQSALQWSSIPSAAFLFLGGSLGVILYAAFYLCDPVLNQSETGIVKYDQLVPYFLITRLQSIPGLSGLCIAGIFSASLSTISSALNSLSLVTVVDFIQPFYSKRLTESKLVFISKTLALLYGIIFICCTFAATKANSLVELTMMLLSVIEGPIVAVFLIGVLTRKASDKIILFSLMLGLAFTTWIGFGTILSGYIQPSLPLETTKCLKSNASMLMTSNTTVFCTDFKTCSEKPETSETFVLYKIAFSWMTFIGCSFTTCVTFILVLVTGWNHNVIPVDSKCLSPVTRRWYQKIQYTHEHHPVKKEDVKNFTNQIKAESTC